ncbi:MAG: hypothetical protein WCE65_04695 [Methanoregula sp.]
MKLQGFLIICLVGIAFAGMVGPVSGANTAALTGTLGSNIGITVNTASVALAGFTAGSTATGADTITIFANSPRGATISVADSGAAPHTIPGYMSNATGAVYQAPNTELATPLVVAGTASTVQGGTTITGSTTSGPIGTTASPTSLYSANGPLSTITLPVSFTQVVTLTDPTLITGNQYRMDLTFTIASN